MLSAKRSSSKRKANPLISPARNDWLNWISSSSSIGPSHLLVHGHKRKGADRGVDGLLFYYDTELKDIPGRVKEEAPLRREQVHREKIIVQVKGGGVSRGDVAILLGDVHNQKAAAGILITLEKPTKQMRTEAADAGRYTSKLWHEKDYPRIQDIDRRRSAQRNRADQCSDAS
jgi:hypothetical protein